MYGIPLTILFASKYFFKHRVALPPNVIELEFLGVGLAMDHAMVYGAVVMILGMLLIIFGWWSLYWQSQRPGFAQRGLYAYSRHPQYLGFILLLVGWLIGWPTIITLIFSPILIYKYWRAARKEEQEMLKQYDQVYLKYIRKTPFFI
jgi:protein-S-isoprenylcysteine O-methyltransferase Ste14